MEEVKPSASYHILLEEFELTKKALGETEETLKRITGRTQDLFNGPGGQNKNKWKGNTNVVDASNGRKRGLPPFRKNQLEEGEIVFGEESPEEEEPDAKKPSLQSTVVANPKDLKSRKDTIQEQNVNSKVKARNRRMLGMILGTLQKFQHDAKKTEEKDQKRAVIEQKVEAAALEEKERLKKEKEELFQARREKQTKLRCLEKKMEIAELHETWENNHMNLTNFIVTTAEPHICFLPAVENDKSKALLEESKKRTLELIKERREKMEKEMAEVEELYKKDNFPIDKENIGPMETNNNETHEMPNLPPDVSEELPVPTGENNTTLDTDERTNDTNLPNLADQEFEPIYD